MLTSPLVAAILIPFAAELYTLIAPASFLIVALLAPPSPLLVEPFKNIFIPAPPSLYAAKTAYPAELVFLVEIAAPPVPALYPVEIKLAALIAPVHPIPPATTKAPLFEELDAVVYAIFKYYPVLPEPITIGPMPVLSI